MPVRNLICYHLLKQIICCAKVYKK